MAAHREVNALAVALESESLEALYAAWLEFRLARAAAAATRSREREQLDVKAEYLLKAVEAARALPGEKPKKSKAKGKKKALAVLDPLAQFHADAQAEVERARQALDAREKAEEGEAAKVDARVRKALLERADLHLRIHKPRFELTVHPVGKDQTLLEVRAPGDEDAALLMRLLHGKLPTRWGFFSDDAVEDLARGTPKLYPDEGVKELFPQSVDDEDAPSFGKGAFSPARMQLPFAIPGKPWPHFRLVHHGPIAQVEARAKGKAYSHLVPRADSELLSGYLLRLKLAGQLDLDLRVG